MKTVSVIAISLALLSVARPAHATGVEDAKAHYEAGLSAYALGHYAEAAEEYEKAFAVKADRALLYNAAQAHRLAGNKPRALLLYKNYLSLFDHQPNRDEVQRHIAALKAAIESDKAATTSPPTDPAPVGRVTETPRPVEEPKPAATVVEPAVAASITAPPPPPRKRVKPWVFGVIGGAVVAVGLGLGLGLGLSGQVDPNASFGTARVHP